MSDDTQIVVSEDIHSAIHFIAVVQTMGILTDVEATVSRAFNDWQEAVLWVREIVEDAHGGIAVVVNSFTKFNYDFGGEPHTERRRITYVLTADGPTNGFVIETFNPTKID